MCCILGELMGGGQRKALLKGSQQPSRPDTWQNSFGHCADTSYWQGSSQW